MNLYFTKSCAAIFSTIANHEKFYLTFCFEMHYTVINPFYLEKMKGRMRERATEIFYDYKER